MVLVGLSGNSGSSDVDLSNLLKALGFALAAGLALSFCTLGMKYSLDKGFDPDQSWYDCNLLLGLGILPFYLYQVINENDAFNVTDYGFAFGAIIMLNSAIITLGFAI